MCHHIDVYWHVFTCSTVKKLLMLIYSFEFLFFIMPIFRSSSISNTIYSFFLIYTHRYTEIKRKTHTEKELFIKCLSNVFQCLVFQKIIFLLTLTSIFLSLCVSFLRTGLSMYTTLASS